MRNKFFIGISIILLMVMLISCKQEKEEMSKQSITQITSSQEFPTEKTPSETFPNEVPASEEKDPVIEELEKSFEELDQLKDI